MDPALIIILLKDLIIPEVMVAIRAHQAVTGTLPTDEQIIAALQLDADRYIAIGESFLARTGGVVTVAEATTIKP